MTIDLRIEDLIGGINHLDSYPSVQTPGSYKLHTPSKSIIGLASFRKYWDPKFCLAGTGEADTLKELALGHRDLCPNGCNPDG